MSAMTAINESSTPSVAVEGEAVPVRKISGSTLQQLGGKFKGMFDRYASERIPAEQRYLKNLRQYLGIYDPDIERELPRNRSRAYPRLTRMKCISMLSRIMNLMFPGNEDNWELNASPSPSMDPQAVQQAVQTLMQEQQQQVPSQSLIDSAVNRLAASSAMALTLVIKDQLLELGGNQTLDWVALNRKVAESGIRYGIGILEGPYVRKVEESGWVMVEGGQFQPTTRTTYKPQFDHMSVWDFYPDMSSRTLPGEGYFVRKVLGTGALKKLRKRADFMKDQIDTVLRAIPGGNYKAKAWETELRTMGTAIQADSTSMGTSGREKYEIIIWKGPVSGQSLRDCGADVSDELVTEDIDAELWLVDNYVIKADINAWRKLGMEVQQVHIFSFDEDDTSPISQGLPYVVRDSQLSICAATRMTLDNASVTCGPNLEINTSLLRTDQDLTGVQPYKIWYRDDDGPSAQFPAVRRVEIDGHLAELQGLVRMFLEFAEMETFIGPSTGGDMTKVPSEAMRTAVGGSMLRSDAALPFKDIVRNYDSFTQSVIWSMVEFNKKFNPDQVPDGDYDVIPRGATSLIAKEVRGQQIDMLSQTLTPEERDHIDERKFIEAKLASRDLQGMLVTPDEAAQRQAQKAQMAQQQQDQQNRMMEATIKDTLAGAFKNVSQGQKNTTAANKASVDTAISLMNSGQPDGEGSNGGTQSKAA